MPFLKLILGVIVSSVDALVQRERFQRTLTSIIKGVGVLFTLEIVIVLAAKRRHNEGVALHLGYWKVCHTVFWWIKWTEA